MRIVSVPPAWDKSQSVNSGFIRIRQAIGEPTEMMRIDGRFSDAERDAVYRAIFERRDVRRNFLSTPIPDHILMRVLTAAHHAGSVGFMQPWDFVVVRDRAVKSTVKKLFLKANVSRNTLPGKRAAIEISSEDRGAPINIGVTYSRQQGGPHVLGRSKVRDTDLYSTCCAIQNLWLAARKARSGMGQHSRSQCLKTDTWVPKPVKVGIFASGMYDFRHNRIWPLPGGGRGYRWTSHPP